MDCGGGVSPEQGGEPLPVGECGAGGSVTHGHQVPLAGGLGQGGAHGGAARDDNHLLVLLFINQFVQTVRSKPAVTLNSKRNSYNPVLTSDFTLYLVILVGEVNVIISEDIVVVINVL